MLWPCLVGRSCPSTGHVVWLTADQGGRKSGPPVPTENQPRYASSAYVPPADFETGLASFVIEAESSAFRSKADAGWLVVPNEGVHHVVPGSVLVVTEGAQTVAYFEVSAID